MNRTGRYGNSFTWAVALGALVALAACNSTGDERQTAVGGIANVLPHVAGADVVNVHCPLGRWEPVSGNGAPVAVILDGMETTSITITPGEQRNVAVNDGRVLGVLCVDDDLPVFGDDWIGKWATISMVTNSNWPSVLKMQIAAGQQVEEDVSETCGFILCDRNYQVLVDPNGVIRWYVSSGYMISALEYDHIGGGLVAYEHGKQPSAPGVPPIDSKVLVYNSRPANAAAAPDLSISSPDGSVRLDGHDYAVLSNGNYLLIGYEIVDETPTDRSGRFHGLRACKERSITQYRHTLRARILEYTTEGTLVRVWRSEDHIPPIAGPDVRPAVLFDAGRMVCALDLEHANAIDVDPDGRVILGFRNAYSHAIAVNWPTGSVAWTLGGEHEAALNITGDPLGGPRASHDAKVTRVDGRTFLHILDNNSFRGPARYVRYLIDEKSRTAELSGAVTLRCGGEECYTLFMGSLNVLSEEGETEVLANPGGPIGEDITAARDGELLLYRGERLVRSIGMGNWWAYRVAVLPEEPWNP